MQNERKKKLYNTRKCCSNPATKCEQIIQLVARALVPLLLDVKGPLPLQELVLVIIGENTLYVVVAATNDPGRSIFKRGLKHVGLTLWTIAAHHEVGPVNWRKKRDKMQAGEKKSSETGIKGLNE